MFDAPIKEVERPESLLGMETPRWVRPHAYRMPFSNNGDPSLFLSPGALSHHHGHVW